MAFHARFWWECGYCSRTLTGTGFSRDIGIRNNGLSFTRVFGELIENLLYFQIELLIKVHSVRTCCSSTNSDCEGEHNRRSQLRGGVHLTCYPLATFLAKETEEMPINVRLVSHKKLDWEHSKYFLEKDVKLFAVGRDECQAGKI